MGRPSRFSPEVRESAARMVEDYREAHASEWAVLQSVAPKLGRAHRALDRPQTACPQRPQALISSLYKPGVGEFSMTVGGGNLNDR